MTIKKKNVYMATAVDAGELMDIHPQDKKTVGKRMAINEFPIFKNLMTLLLIANPNSEVQYVTLEES